MRHPAQPTSKAGFWVLATALLLAFFMFVFTFTSENQTLDNLDFTAIPLSPSHNTPPPSQGTTTEPPRNPSQGPPNRPTPSGPTNTPERPNTGHQNPPNTPESPNNQTQTPTEQPSTSPTPSNTPTETPSQNQTDSTGGSTTNSSETGNYTVPKNYGNKVVFENPLKFNQINNPGIPTETYIPNLEIEWTLYGPDHLNVVIRDADKKRFELPYEEPYAYPKHPPLSDLAGSNFDVDIKTEPFSIVIKRKSTQEVIFELVDRLVYSDLYLEFSIRPPTNSFYGFGERAHRLSFSPGIYTLYILDRLGKIDPGVPGFNTNGHHSVYLCAEESKKYHMFVLRNFNSQEVVIGRDRHITWKTIGGVLDFNFFIGDTPDQAVDLYHEYLGGWTMPAFWHLGSHQSKWSGYKNTDDLEYVLKGYDRVKVPLDALWSDLDIFKREINLLYDDVNFPPNRTNELFRQYKKRWIPVIQEYVPVQHESPAWTFPNVENITIRDGLDPSKPSLGVQYSGAIYFVDNFHPDSEAFWYKMYDILDSNMHLSGIWLDANEVTNFMHINWPGPNSYTYADHYRSDPMRKYYNLPFQPGNNHPYHIVAVDFDSLHYGGIVEYDVRGFNAFHQARHAYTYLQKRGFYFPFVLSRGNIMGIGKYASHFIPDVDSSWEAMRVATAQVNMYNIYGITMVGPDICGMNGEQQTAPELCARWYQIASFYTFHRNQHQKNNQPNFQEPYRYSGIYFDSIAASIKLRYSILKQMYAIFFRKKRAPLSGTGTIFRPMFFEFSTDTNLPPYGSSVHEDQFMLGDLLMAAPAVYPNARTMDTYFPDWRWYDLRDCKEIPARGKTIAISAELTELAPHFLRGGHIFFKQDVEGVMRTDDLDNKFKVYVGLNDLKSEVSKKSSEAIGHIMSATDYEEKYIYENCALKNCLLKTTVLYQVNLDSEMTMITVKVESVEPSSTTDAIEVNEISIMGVAPESLGQEQHIECLGCTGGDSVQFSSEEGWIKISSLKLEFKDGVSYTFKLNKA